MSKILSTKKVPETLKVEFEDGFYCLITPLFGEEGYREFWMFHKDYGFALQMLGCEIAEDEEAIALAENAADEYIQELQERMENEGV